MKTEALIQAITAKLVYVEDQLTLRVGPASLCTLEKSHQMTQSMKYLEGQQQAYRGALRALRHSGDSATLTSYLQEAHGNNEALRHGAVGAAPQWQAYLEGSVAALAQIQELLNIRLEK